MASAAQDPVSALPGQAGTQTGCPRCGAGLAPDQDWCLECGDAVTTRIRAAPDWRVPAAIVGAVVALAVAGLVLALIALSNSADRSLPASPAPASAAAPGAPAPKRGHAATTAATSTPTTAASATIGSWPTGVTGFTVVLGVIPAKAAATASATRLASAGIPVGLLYSSGYSSMRPGDWIVFSGTYSTRARADAAAAELKAKGQTGAYAFPVVPAG